MKEKNISEYNNDTNGTFTLTKEHNLTYEEHNYNRIDIIKKDINELPINRIKKKLENYYYLYDFIKAYTILNSENNYTMISLQKEIEAKYGKLNINFNTIKKDDIDKKINSYKKKHNIKDDQNIEIEKLYNINNIIRSSYNSIRLLKEFKNIFTENITNLKINDENITTKLKVNFIRKNKSFEKELFILMTKEMENNLISEDNSQYFADCTYYAIPPNKSKYKLFLILAFNKKKQKSVLCNISIISNENKETFITVLNFLKIKYNFTPKIMATDYSKSLILSIKHIFPNILLIPCFFHFIQNNIKKLPEIRSKTKTIKEYAKDCLANIRLLCFIDHEKINNFYKDIKDKYRSKFPKYFKYFDINYMNENARFKKIWNYNDIFMNNMDKHILFYTNNICESMNRTLNMKFIGGCKTFFNFKNCIKDIIDMYEKNNKVYQEINGSITRALEYYVKKTLVITLIKNEDLKKIKMEYKKFMLDNKYPMLENSYDSDSISNYEKKIPSFIDITSSSDSEENDFSSDISNEDKNDSNDNKDIDEENKNSKNLKKIKKKNKKKLRIKKINLEKKMKIPIIFYIIVIF